MTIGFGLRAIVTRKASWTRTWKSDDPDRPTAMPAVGDYEKATEFTGFAAIVIGIIQLGVGVVAILFAFA